MKMLKKAAGMILTSAVMLGMAATAFGAGNMPTAVDGTKGVKTSENFENLFDGSVGTKWCVAKTDPYVIFSLPSQQSVTGYTLVTANDSLQWKGRNPKSWTLYGCNSAAVPGVDDSGWTVIDSVTEDETMKNQNSTAYEFALDQPAPAYQYYKFQVEEKGLTMQLSELILEYGGSSQAVQQMVDGANGINNGEGPDRMLDGKASTKWCTINSEPWIIVEMTTPVSAKGYYMVTGNDSSRYKGRNPKSWTLYGCNADTAPDENYGGWEVVHQVTDDTAVEDRNAASYYFALGQASPAYRYYMLQIEEKQSSMMQLSEFAIDYEGLTFGYTGLNGTTSTESSESSGGVSGPLMCGSCAGRGSNHCFVCQGSGISSGEQCDNCGGTGEVRCTACNGTGWIQKRSDSGGIKM